MGQDSAGWRFFRQWAGEKAAERRQEKDWAHQLMMYEKQREDEAEQKKQANIWQEHRDIAQMFHQAYSQANTPMEKESVRNNWMGYSKTMPQNMRHGVEQLLKDSPLSIQGMDDARWWKENPSPPAPNFRPEENMYKYATMAYAQEMHKARFAKERRGQEHVIPTEIPLDGDTFAFLDSTGKVQLEKYELKNKFVDQIAEKSGKTAYQLQQDGGWDNWGTTTIYRTDPTTGAQYQDVVGIRQNLFNGKTEHKTFVSGETKKSSTSGRPPHEGALMDPDGLAKNMIGALQTGKRPSEKQPLDRERFDRIEEARERYFEQFDKAKSDVDKAKTIREFSLYLDNELKTLDNRFVYSIISSPGKPALETEGSLWYKKWKLGKEAFIMPLYGQRSSLKTKDGRVVEVVVDNEHNRISLMDGTSLGTIVEATSFIGSYTAEELENKQ